MSRERETDGEGCDVWWIYRALVEEDEENKTYLEDVESKT